MSDLLVWIEGTDLASIARESLYGFQILVAIHILGIVFSVGLLLWVDLRMLGLCLPGVAVADVYRAFSRWFAAGFAVMFASGAMLFAGFATSAWDNTFFRIKLVAIALAGANALAFHLLLQGAPVNPAMLGRASPVRLAGALSLGLWTVVILCGRMMSYTLF